MRALRSICTASLLFLAAGCGEPQRGTCVKPDMCKVNETKPNCLDPAFGPGEFTQESHKSGANRCRALGYTDYLQGQARGQVVPAEAKLDTVVADGGTGVFMKPGRTQPRAPERPSL